MVLDWRERGAQTAPGAAWNDSLLSRRIQGDFRMDVSSHALQRWLTVTPQTNCNFPLMLLKVENFVLNDKKLFSPAGVRA